MFDVQIAQVVFNLQFNILLNDVLSLPKRELAEEFEFDHLALVSYRLKANG